MARVTVEDCVQRVPNRFELVMLAAQRSRDISAGSPLTVERDNDKNPVVALREIADGTIELDELREEIIRGLQKYVEIDEPEEENPMELIAAAAMVGEEMAGSRSEPRATPAASGGEDAPKADSGTGQDAAEGAGKG